MESMNEIDVKDLCRICASGSGKDAVFLLIDGDVKTELGEIFESCIGLQLRKPGFPNRLCNYCQFQLNTFHAFLKKAEASNSTFEEIFGNAQDDALEDEPSDQYEKHRYVVMHGMDEHSENEMEFIDETYKSPKREFIEERSDEELLANEDDANALTALEHSERELAINDGDESDYLVEYLEMDETSVTYNEDADGDADADIDANRDEEEDVDNDGISETDVTIPTTASSTTAKSGAKRTAGTTSKQSYPFRCKKCARRFMYKEVYDAHMRVHKGLPAFACPNCPKTFSEKANFDYHMQDYTNYRPAKCTMCEKSFKNKQDLASHIRCHKDIRKYMCDICGKRFRSQSHMVYHRYSHFEERNFHCDLCTQSFKSPHILRTHRNTVHSKVFRYECEECGRKFKRDHHLIAHRGVHLRAKLKNGIKKEIQE